MRFKEYGDPANPAIMLIHGGGTSTWMYEGEAELLKEKYFVVLPVLDGHGGEETTFVSSGDSAKKLVGYVLEKLGGRLMLVGGGSLGAQTALEVMADSRIKISRAILESGIYFRKRAMARISSFPPLIRYSMRLYDNEKAMKRSFDMNGWDSSFFDAFVSTGKQLSFQSSRNLYRTYFDYEPPKNLAQIDIETVIIHGAAEKKIIVDDAKAIEKQLPNCRALSFEGYRHCEFCINHPEEYAALVEELCSGL